MGIEVVEELEESGAGEEMEVPSILEGGSECGDVRSRQIGEVAGESAGGDNAGAVVEHFVGEESWRFGDPGPDPGVGCDGDLRIGGQGELPVYQRGGMIADFEVEPGEGIDQGSVMGVGDPVGNFSEVRPGESGGNS